MSSIFKEELGKNKKINTSGNSFLIWLEKLNHIFDWLICHPLNYFSFSCVTVFTVIWQLHHLCESLSIPVNGYMCHDIMYVSSRKYSQTFCVTSWRWQSFHFHKFNLQYVCVHRCQEPQWDPMCSGMWVSRVPVTQQSWMFMFCNTSFSPLRDSILFPI